MAASAGHQLVMQRGNIETRIKTLINNDLRALCRVYGQIVSGTKPQLQARCIQVLAEIVQKGDVDAFNQFSTRVSNHGFLPTNYLPQQQTNTPTYTQAGPSHLSGTAQRHPPPIQGHPNFKHSPFHERLETIIRATDLPEMPQNRHTVKCNLILNDDQARRLSSDPDQYRLMIYCAMPVLGAFAPLDIAFPSQIEVKVNEDDVKANFKGLKNKPGSTKPADITKFVRARAGYMNKLWLCYALTQKRFIFTVVLVRYVSTPTLTQRIRTARVFPKAKVLEEYARKNADSEVVAMSSKMSLKDPVSTMRIVVPVRSSVCEHNQCFDASFYLQLQEQAPTWTCPICAKNLSFESLGVDKYFEEILQSTPQSIDQVTVQPDGQWSVIKDDQEKSLSNAAKNAPRAAYDDDFDDDDIVELDIKPKATIIKESDNTNSWSTPPASSREASVSQPQSHPPKRKSAVIDLTFSDDDEPIRPAKRARVTESMPHPQVHTPSSLYDSSHNASRSKEPLTRPATSAPSRPHSMFNIGSMQAPIVLPTGASHPPRQSTLDRPPGLAQQHSSNSSNNSHPSIMNAFGSASAEFARRWSGSISPTRYGGESNTMNTTAWQPPPPAQGSRPGTLQPGGGSYHGFAQDQSRSPSLQNGMPNSSNSMPNGFNYPSAHR